MVRISDARGLYIPEAVLKDTQLSPNLKVVYAAMLAHAAPDGLCDASCVVIGHEIGMEATAVQANRRRLAAVGYIDVVPNTTRFWLLRHLEGQHGNG